MKRFLAAAIVAATLPMAAQDTKAAASPENYMRSSLYTVLMISDLQNKALDEESQKQGMGASLIKAFAKPQAQSDMSASAAPQAAFFQIPIPDQFNDHNVFDRTIKFDDIKNSITEEDKTATQAKKKGGFGKMLGNAAKDMALGAVGISADNPNGEVDELGAAAGFRFLKANAVPELMVGKWFGYTPEADSKWNTNLLIERGLYDASEEEKARAAQQGMQTNLFEGRGLELINNTYAIAFNLRFRSNQAIVAEAEKVAAAVGSQFGGIGQLAAMGASVAASAAAGEGFQVQVQAYLYKLAWNPDAEAAFADQIFAKNATMEDLINSGLCSIEYVGTEKAGARVRQSLTNTKVSQSDLIQRATNRAIDNAIAKLQEKNEVFRTAFPISRIDEDGNVYAKVGMKEGIEKDDEYEILEMNEDPKKGIVWKSVGKVKAVDKKIWDNRAGAAEDVAADAEENPDDKKLADAKASVDLGETAFKGAKKGKDFRGYFLRLKKKK